jgi:glutathione synthase
MGIKLGVVMDPIEGIHYKKDTTLALLWAAQDRGWSLFYMTPDALFLDGERPMAVARSLTVHRDPAHWFDAGEPEDISLADLDIC